MSEINAERLPNALRGAIREQRPLILQQEFQSLVNHVGRAEVALSISDIIRETLQNNIPALAKEHRKNPEQLFAAALGKVREALPHLDHEGNVREELLLPGAADKSWAIDPIQDISQFLTVGLTVSNVYKELSNAYSELEGVLALVLGDDLEKGRGPLLLIARKTRGGIGQTASAISSALDNLIDADCLAQLKKEESSGLLAKQALLRVLQQIVESASLLEGLAALGFPSYRDDSKATFANAIFFAVTDCVKRCSEELALHMSSMEYERNKLRIDEAGREITQLSINLAEKYGIPVKETLRHLQRSASCILLPRFSATVSEFQIALIHFRGEAEYWAGQVMSRPTSLELSGATLQEKRALLDSSTSVIHACYAENNIEFKKAPVQTGDVFSVGRTVARFRALDDLQGRRAEKALLIMRDDLGILPSTAAIGGYALSYESGKSDDQRFVCMALPEQQPVYVRPRNVAGKKEVLREALDSVSILTGICLYSTDGASLKLKDGRRLALTNPGVVIDGEVETLLTREGYSLYELESLLRLGSFVRGLTANDKIKDVKVHVPQIEYYLYVLDAFTPDANGRRFMNASAVIEWMSKVDERSNVLLQAMQTEIGDKVSVEKIAPLAPVAEYLRGCVAGNMVPALSEVVRILIQGDSLWREILEIKPVQTWHEINYRSYVYALLDVSQAELGARHLGLAVDNPVEERIFHDYQSIMSKLSSRFLVRAAGLYVHEKVLIPADSSGNAPQGVDTKSLYVSGGKLNRDNEEMVRSVYGARRSYDKY